MGFVNERIPEADKERHNITPQNDFYRAGAVSWTVDRDRDMFLVKRTSPGPEGTPGVSGWAFYWRGHLLDVRLRLIDAGGDSVAGHGWERTKLLFINGLGAELDSKREQVIADLKEALTARKGLGIHSRRTSYAVTLDI